MKDCLDCKYEPDWSEWSGGEYSICYGRCKWDKEIPVLPKIYSLTKKSIIRYSDDSGVVTRCKAWKPK